MPNLNNENNNNSVESEIDGSNADESALFLIVGLGNPGEDYAETRHNAGFKVIDALADDTGVHYWKSECGALTGKGTWHGIDVVLAKPQSFMNSSGGPVKQLMEAYGVDTDHLVVIHDDLDILPGNVRVKFGGGHAGHNGLRSLFDKTGTRDWFRVRIGIGYPSGCMGTTDYVLMAPRRDAAEDFAFAIDRGTQATLYLLEHGLEKTQQQFNQTTQTDRNDQTDQTDQTT